MKNTIKTIICFIAVVATLILVSFDLLVKQEESSSRVAHLEGRVDELEQQAEQLNSENASLTDAIQKKDVEIASLTDAVNDKIEVTTEQVTTTTENTEQSTTEYATMVFSKTADDEDGVFDVSVAAEYRDAKEELDNSYVYVGCYELTAYIATGNPCADGVYPQVGYTVACNDPSLWHKWIYIEGYGTYFVHDTGGMSSNSIIDIFMGSYDEAIQFGRRSANIYIME